MRRKGVASKSVKAESSSARGARDDVPASLEKYRKKRDFSRTSEPRPGPVKARRRSTDGRSSFVIQKHAARRLHYDFRLEIDGVLMSWAVPKGPSLDPTVKRLAVETEPHPLEYGKFEGIIPEGEYGAGTVMLWDRGTWRPEGGDARAAYEKGRLSFELDGEKLHGTWHLVRTARGSKPKAKSAESQEGTNWLLFKSRDRFARPGENGILEAEPSSVASGRSIDEIKGAPDVSSWSGRTGKVTKRAGKKKRWRMPSKLPVGATLGKLPETARPELATLVDRAPSGDAWLHEIKFDGYRVLARVDHGEVRLLTRQGLDWTERMPVLAQALHRLDVETALIDGELVALNDAGRSDFQLLQNSLGQKSRARLVYFAFDLLHVNGVELSGAPLIERKNWLFELLRASLPEGERTIRASEHVLGGGERFFAKACELGLEGIVSKRAASPYRPGRGRDWQKTKCTGRQEFVIVGYTDPGGSRSHFGALLLGVRGEERGSKGAPQRALVYAGRVGTGFTARSLEELHGRLKPLEVDEPPVENPPRGADARGVHWVKPVLVAEVAFTGFTEEGMLRHPVFHGLREDKPASKVVREKPAYPLSNPERVLYPEQGITKRELFEYYELVAERILPHVVNRPLTLLRCPSGRERCFFQRHPPARGMPNALRTVSIPERERTMPHGVIDDVEGLYGLVQLGTLEIHTWGARADDLEHPDLLVFDLDPDPALEFQRVIEGARAMFALFEAAKLESFVKTTGGKGLHVCVPIRPSLDWESAKAFSLHVVQELARRAPDRYVATPAKAKRRGKIYLDYLRNSRAATFIAPYSTRARENAPVAVPLEWDELTRRLDPGAFTLRTLARRLKRLGNSDPFSRMAKLRQVVRPDEFG